MRNARHRVLQLSAILTIALSTSGSQLMAQFATDGNGLIVGDQWLALGPFQTPVACDSLPGLTGLYGNFIGPGSHIACQAPEEGDSVEDYDPFDPTNPGNGITEIVGVNVDDEGNPVWWALDDGSPADGDLFLDGTVLGDLTEQVIFLATYVEYLGDEPIVVQFCHGTDDDGQVWIDDRLVQNQLDCSGLSDCEYSFPALITPGPHVIKMGVFEQAGGWAARLSMRVNGLPVVDGDPDWVFLGREGDVELADCEADEYLTYDPPERVTCEPNEDGSVSLSWGNSIDTDPGADILILANDEVVATLPGGSVEYTIPADEAEDADLFCIRSAGGLDACISCGGEATDPNGNILGRSWLTFGPFTRGILQCPSNVADLSRNTIPPTRIDCYYPEEGEEVEYDGFDPESSTVGLVELGFNVGPSLLPLVHRFNDGTNANDDLNLDQHYGASDNVFAWMITYAEYIGDTDTAVDICFGSDDDAQIWFNERLVASQPDCSGAPDCEYLVSGVEITAGQVYRIAVGVWETGGGWNLRFRMTDSFTQLPIADGDPNWIFHGTEMPGFDPPDCPECELAPVTNLSCSFDEGGDLVLDWENPEVTDATIPTRILAGGAEVATVASDETTAIVPGGLLPVGNFSVQVIHCGGVPAECSPFATDDAGNLLSGNWLVVGPLTRGITGCPSLPEDMLRSTVPPTRIDCLTPEEGDELEYDSFDPESSTIGLVDVGFNVGPNGLPLVHRFDDGTNVNDFLDLDEHFGPQDNMVAWLFTYIEYVGVGGTAIDICFASDDDSQIWFNGNLIANQPDCSGAPDCEYQAFGVPIEAGTIYRVAIAVFETAGGWQMRFRMTDSNTLLPIVDGDPNWVFHGTERPDDLEELPCDDLCLPPSNLICTRNGDGSVDLTWEDSGGCDADVEVLAGGSLVATLEPGTTSYTIDAEDLEFASSVTLDNGAFATTTCSLVEILPGLLGNDLTDIGDDGLEDLYAPPNLGGFDAFFFASDEPTFGAGEAAFNVFDNVVGGGLDKWCCGTVFPQIVGADFRDTLEAEYVLTSFTVSSANDAPDRDPRVWRIEGSNDDVTWTTIFEQNDPTNSLWTARLQTLRFEEGRDYPLQTEGYAMFRMVTEATGLATGAFFQLGEIEFFGEESGARENCTNGVDDDGDDLIDCDDPSCARSPACTGGAEFVRGDADGSGAINLTDGVAILLFSFQGAAAPACLDAADTDDSGSINLTDPVIIFQWLFLGGNPPVSPTPSSGNYVAADCGPDPDASDTLDCANNGPVCVP